MEKVKVGDVFHFFAKPMVAAIHVTDSAVVRPGDLVYKIVT